MLPCSGVVARFPLLSGAVASTMFLAASFSALAVCLIPALRWQYGNIGATITTVLPGTRSRGLQGALGEKRTRKRSLKRSGSVSHVKLEVCLCMNPGLHDRFSHICQDQESAITLPPSETTPSALRRRRSMVSDPVFDSD
jgi:hypothetical protein